MPSWRGANALYIARKLGLATGLQMCHDAGDGVSLPAASDTYNDLSGAALHFFLGSGTGADAADPTIAGTADQLAVGNKLTFDGGDFLILNQSNPAWINRLHQDSAKFGALFLIDHLASSVCIVFGTNGGNLVGDGVHMLVGSANNAIAFRVRNAGAEVLSADAGPQVPSGPALIGVSIDEAAGTGFMYSNGASVSFTSAYSSPSAGAASQTMRFASRNDVHSASGNGWFADWFWEGVAPTKAEFDAVFNAIRGRVGI